MAHAIQLIPTHSGVGATSCILGLYHAFERLGLKTTYFKPISQVNEYNQLENSTLDIINNYSDKKSLVPISADKAKQLLSDGNEDSLLEEVITSYEKLTNDYDIIIIEGLKKSKLQPYAINLNQLIIRAIGTDIVLASDAININKETLISNLEFAAKPYGGVKHKRVLGAIINRTNNKDSLTTEAVQHLPIFDSQFKLLAAIEGNKELIYPRTLDIMNFLKGQAIHLGDINNRRISDYAIIARTIPNAIKFLEAGRLIFTPSDRDDVLMATSLAATSKEIAGIILTGETEPTESVLSLCKKQIESTKLPVIRVSKGSWEIAREMEYFNEHIPPDDIIRTKKTMEYFADFIDKAWCQEYSHSKTTKTLSPAAFKYQIVKRAQSDIKRIVLPEGDEPRTIEAAVYCSKKNIAECILLAKESVVQTIIDSKGLNRPESLKIIDPGSIRGDYISRLIELRKHKGMNETLAETQLSDNVMLGTMMLEANRVNGLVSGAIHTTANTIRPPLQIIKTAQHAKLVSSVFFMCLSEQVYVYGDCAINPNPNAEQLADIAIQSAQSAASFGLDPKIAMISYSTGQSGHGEDVEKVRAATQIVQQRHPEIVIDGPLQYDAAAIQSVAKSKAPNSPVAGKANVFIFPDLNTGNTTYKAVQRSANAISIGPMLQGMKKPVNDLSRGALVEDIIYTIAITAIQAQK